MERITHAEVGLEGRNNHYFRKLTQIDSLSMDFSLFHSPFLVFTTVRSNGSDITHLAKSSAKPGSLDSKRSSVLEE
jgi:hypothetical protein